MTRVFILLAALALSACTTPNSDKDFLCDAQEGQPCRTMAEVDGQVTRSPGPNVRTSTRSTTRAVASGTAHRVPERTGRMWIAPYHDGALVHEGSTVRFVVRNGRWAQ